MPKKYILIIEILVHKSSHAQVKKLAACIVIAHWRTWSKVCWPKSVVDIITPATKEPNSRLRPSLSLHWKWLKNAQVLIWFQYVNTKHYIAVYVMLQQFNFSKKTYYKIQLKPSISILFWDLSKLNIQTFKCRLIYPNKKEINKTNIVPPEKY